MTAYYNCMYINNEHIFCYIKQITTKIVVTKGSILFNLFTLISFKINLINLINKQTFSLYKLMHYGYSSD